MTSKVLDLNSIGLDNLMLKYEMDTCNFENIKSDLSVY